MFDPAYIVVELLYLRTAGEYWSYVMNELCLRSLNGEPIVSSVLRPIICEIIPISKSGQVTCSFRTYRGPLLMLAQAAAGVSVVCSEVMEDANRDWWIVIFKNQFLILLISFFRMYTTNTVYRRRPLKASVVSMNYD